MRGHCSLLEIMPCPKNKYPVFVAFWLLFASWTMREADRSHRVRERVSHKRKQTQNMWVVVMWHAHKTLGYQFTAAYLIFDITFMSVSKEKCWWPDFLTFGQIETFSLPKLYCSRLHFLFLLGVF